jgi:hypothetical protein
VGGDGAGELEGGGLEEGAEGGAGDQLGDLVADEVDAEDVVGGGVGDDLAEAVGLAPDQGAAVAAEGEVRTSWPAARASASPRPSEPI